MLPSRMPSAPLPLLLLPGTLCDERVFAPLLRRLLAAIPSLTATVMDTAQHQTLRSAAEHVLARAPSRFALLGFSLGGLVALETALLAPERVSGLALLNVNAAPPPALTHAARREAVVLAEALGHGEYVRQHLWPNYVAPSAQADDALRELIAAMAQDLGHAAFHRQTEAALGRRDYRPLVSALPMPTLVQAGEFDLICPVAGQAELAASLPNAVFDLIPGAGHFALLERQDEVAASVAGWFHTVSEEQS